MSRSQQSHHESRLGIIDSGIGGLSVVYILTQLHPSLDFVYFGDSANTPYGNRPIDELTALARNAVDIVQQRGATTIVVACHTLSTTVQNQLKNERPQLTFIGMKRATKTCIQHASHQRIVIAATAATIDSGIYQSFGRADQYITGVVSTTLAAAIESKDEPAIQHETERIVSIAQTQKATAILLGCTHYPLATQFFKNAIANNNIKLLDPAQFLHVPNTPLQSTDGHQLFLASKTTPLLRSTLQKRYNATPQLVTQKSLALR